MKRVALLGATGSIGRQALEIVEAHPELELVAAASGSQPIVGLAPLTQVGGDLTELLDRAEPDLVVHALVRFRDGAALAHLGYPDMRVPISFALTYPERAETPIPALDLASGLTLEFHAPDLDTFPLLALARQAGEDRGTSPCVFNAANEVGVAAFLEGRLPFLGIAEAVAETLAPCDR